MSMPLKSAARREKKKLIKLTHTHTHTHDPHSLVCEDKTCLSTSAFIFEWGELSGEPSDRQREPFSVKEDQASPCMEGQSIPGTPYRKPD